MVHESYLGLLRLSLEGFFTKCFLGCIQLIAWVVDAIYLVRGVHEEGNNRIPKIWIFNNHVILEYFSFSFCSPFFISSLAAFPLLSLFFLFSHEFSNYFSCILVFLGSVVFEKPQWPPGMSKVQLGSGICVFWG